MPLALIAASKNGVTGVTICSIRREIEGAASGGNKRFVKAVAIRSVGRDEMIVLKIDFAQKTIAFASGGDVLHFGGTDRGEMCLSVLHERVVHPRSFKVWKGRRSFAPNPIPVVLVWIWICSEVKNSGCVEIECFHHGLCYQVTAAEGSLRASMRGSGSGPP